MDSVKILEDYLNSVSSKYSFEETSEMGYRTDFEILLKRVFESISVSRFDHDAKAKQGNKPDFVVIKNDIPLLYIETKDIGISLDKVEKSEQMSRYYGYTNLVLTDYLEFRFYRNGLPYGENIKVAGYDKSNRRIIPHTTSFENLANTLIDFTKSHKEPIRSGKHLSKIMGGKAQRIRDNIKEILNSDGDKNSQLIDVFSTIKKLLVHDLTIDTFADMYAQTLVYGLFVARFYDESLESFTRQEARDLIPASNPFLAHFFDHIAGRSFEKRLSFIVDELCEVFSHANVAELMDEHFKISSKKGIQKGQDQVIHFYEDFLKEYDDELRKKMGAYYTPLPVVQFIVRSVDVILEKEFGLLGGLSNTSKTQDGVHKVQILDPAVGTGTFISDVIGKIYSRIRDNGQLGRWPAYVHHELLPRLFGFELMMAPYTIAHLKLSMALKKTGFLYFNETRAGKARLGIYLTNSLEEVSAQPELLAFDFGASIANEAKEASVIKNDKPIMVVVGNPPYSVSSTNKGRWIQNLTNDYKSGLNERKINLDDDYIKFIRLAEHFIEKNDSGVVAMITNNSFIDGITHRQMRKHLLETFDSIYILDLHGSSKKKETSPDGGKDENVFDIQQGVSINILIKKEPKKGLGNVYHSDLYGKRTKKFEMLSKKDFETIRWAKLKYTEPYYFFTPKNFTQKSEYDTFIKLDELFIVGGSGIKTERDKTTIHFSNKDLLKVLNDFSTLSISELRSKYDLHKDSRDWTVQRAQDEIKSYGYDFNKHIHVINYRPFDQRVTFYTGKAKHFIGTPGYKIALNFIGHQNLGLLIKRQNKQDFSYAFVVNKIAESCMFESSYANNNVYPLYSYNELGVKNTNFDATIVNEIMKNIGEFKPLDLFDYIYAVLHSPSYRIKYKEFLKIDFPRVPSPKDTKQFQKLVKLGKHLRELHLLESPMVNNLITTYPVTGTNLVDKLSYEDNKIMINDMQYFGNVPEVVWNFSIGGYKPAQKWLKERKNKVLSDSDLEHYQQMIVSLYQTDRTMHQIDDVISI